MALDDYLAVPSALALSFEGAERACVQTRRQVDLACHEWRAFHPSHICLVAEPLLR